MGECLSAGVLDRSVRNGKNALIDFFVLRIAGERGGPCRNRKNVEKTKGTRTSRKGEREGDADVVRLNAMKVTFVTVCYKTPDLIRCLLKGVEAANFSFPFEYVLVDNCAGDGTGDMVRARLAGRSFASLITAHALALGHDALAGGKTLTVVGRRILVGYCLQAGQSSRDPLWALICCKSRLSS